jgi:hypothetical protein
LRPQIFRQAVDAELLAELVENLPGPVEKAAHPGQGQDAALA